jgi:hypothetical protein
MQRTSRMNGARGTPEVFRSGLRQVVALAGAS